MLSKAGLRHDDSAVTVLEDPPVAEECSLVGEETKVVGDLLSEGEIEIQGTIEGNIRSHKVIVGQNGSVHGKIVAEVAEIRGLVDGPVVATSVTVARTARVSGSIIHNQLSIEPGAHIEGRRPWRLRPLEDQDIV